VGPTRTCSQLPSLRTLIVNTAGSGCQGWSLPGQEPALNAIARKGRLELGKRSSNTNRRYYSS
jgi:hypothetical protein